MADGAYEHVMGFVAGSDTYRSQFTEPWQEILSNFMVKADYDFTPKQTSPYRYGSIYRSSRRAVVLKDNETHKLVMSYVAKMMRAMFGDMHHEYVRTRPSGFEDAQKSRTCTRYLRYVFNGSGHFRTFAEALTDMVLFGTSVVESPWKYEEREVLARSRSIHPGTGMLIDSFDRLSIPSYDDVCLRNVDVMDFYPDPSRYRIEEMSGCAKRFRMNAEEARRNPLFNQSAVEEAIGRGTGSPGDKPESIRRGMDQPGESKAPSQSKDMIGYEYWGDVPKDVVLVEQNGRQSNSRRGVVTLLNGIKVRGDAWPLGDYNLPFHTFIINPVVGRFYGISPAEVIRYDQSFADALKVLLAEAMIRRVHPPIAIDINAEYDHAALKAWKADAIVRVSGGPTGVGTLRYDADINSGFAMLQGLKQEIQAGSGSLGATMGEEGPDREAATVGNQRLQFAMERPEMVAMILENECLPPIAKAIVRRGQQFIRDDVDLQRRIGMDPPASLDDLMGDFEVEFVGSRLTMNRQQKLQAFDRMIAMAAAVPAFQMVLPTVELAKEIVGDLLELPEVALQIGQNQAQMLANMLAMQMAGGKGPANNGVPASGEPAGMLPAQAQGG